MSKQHKAGSKDFGRVVFEGFINPTLKAADKKRVKKNLLTPEAILGLIFDVGNLGYKTSFSLDKEGKAWTFTLYGNHIGCKNPGWALSVKHADLTTAATIIWHLLDVNGFDFIWNNVFGSEDDTDW